MPAGYHAQTYWTQKVPKDWVEPILDAAEAEGVSRVEFVRRAILDYLPKRSSRMLTEPQVAEAKVRPRPKKGSNVWCQYVPEDWMPAIDKEVTKRKTSRSAWARRAIRARLPEDIELSKMRTRGNPVWAGQ